MSYREHPRVVTMACDACEGTQTGESGSFDGWREVHVHDVAHRGGHKRDLCPGCAAKVERIFRDVGDGGREEADVKLPGEEVQR